MVNLDKLSAPYGKLCSMYYDAVEGYAAKHEVDFYAEQIIIQGSSGRVLEAMSGSGRLQIPLLQRGYIVDGVDSSSAMLERCKNRCASLGLSPNLYEQSLENLSIDHKYKLIFIPFCSFQLITDKLVALQALKQLRAHMQLGSVLFVDLFVPDNTVDARSTRIAKLDAASFIELITRRQFDNQNKKVSAYCTYTLFEYNIAQYYEEELEEVVWYAETEFEEMLSKAGFKQVEILEQQFRSATKSKVIKAIAI